VFLPTFAATRRPAVARSRSSRLIVKSETFWSLRKGGSEISLIEDHETVKKVCAKGLERSLLAEAFEALGGYIEGIQVEFDAQGSGAPLDSPCELAMKNLGSSVKVEVDGQEVPKGESVKLRAGSHILFNGEEYQVLRNVIAHA
jgi:hypothetical protein